MATPDGQAKQAWHETAKLRKHLIKQIEKLKTESNTHGTNLPQFDTIGETLEQFRLGCVSTIFQDFEYAASENVDEVLWSVHSTLNGEFRRILSRLKSHSHVVERRKVESKYNHFLRIALQFYKGYVQRLSARYDIPELSRVAQGMDTEQMPSIDRISPVPANLSAMVLKSCHITLIHLGDLARYRLQARHKKTGFETALTCYSLAHDLIPESGFAFHQMGIINLDDDNHLEVVYLFYRAWAVKDPHPNAKQNLENKFKSLQSSNGTSRGKPSSNRPHDALVMWFLRLHAIFYKGAPVSSQHTELDKEVMHRLSNAVKDPACASVLFKMSLVNMAAFYIAMEGYNKSQTETASRFCQFALNFNIRFICKLCEAVENDLKELFQRKQSDPQNGSAESGPPPTVEAFLPILRVYAMWLAAHRQEIFSAAEVLESVLPPMLRSFATVFTLLAVDVYSQTDLCTCPYLLPEDLDIRGLRSFDADRASPVSIRTHCTEDGKLKPHLQHPSQRLPSKREHDARILDALRCVYQLAEDKKVPLAARVTENWLIFEYEPHGQSETAQTEQEPTTASLPTPKTNGRINGNGSVSESKVSSPTAHQDGQPSSYRAASNEQPATRPHEPKTAYLDDADKTIVNMLSPFLEDPISEAEDQDPAASADCSYGMHSATANELAEELLANFDSENEHSGRREQTTGANMFGSGIWNSEPVYSPATRSRELNGKANAGQVWSNHGSNRSSRTLLPVPEGLGDDPFASPQFRPVSATHLPSASSVLNSPTSRPISSEDAHRSQLLQAFTDPNARNSPATNWKQGTWGRESNAVLAQPEVSPWGAGEPRRAVPVPSSSNASAFTHMSSLYHGTPNPRAAFEGVGYGAYGNAQPQPQPPSAARDSTQPWPSPRYFQMDETASNYDAAVFQAAWQGND